MSCHDLSMIHGTTFGSFFISASHPLFSRAFHGQNSEVLRSIKAHLFAELLQTCQALGITTRHIFGKMSSCPRLERLAKPACDWLDVPCLNLIQGVAWPYCQAVTGLVAHWSSFNPRAVRNRMALMSFKLENQNRRNGDYIYIPTKPISP